MFKKFLSKKTEQKNFSFTQIGDDSFLSSVLFGGRITPQMASNFYRESSAVAIAVDMIAKEIEQIAPIVKMADGSMNKEHEVLKLLASPNEFDDYREFMGKLARNYLLNHDAYIYAEGSVARAPATIFAIDNKTITTTNNSVDYYPALYSINAGMGTGSYTRSPSKDKTKFYDGNLKEVYHIKGYSSRTNDPYSDSPLEAAALETRQQISGKRHNLKIIENGGRLSLAVIIKGDEPPTQEQFDQIEARANERFAGADNSGKIAVFGASDLEIKEMGQTNKDMDFASLEKMSREGVFTRYGIPLPIVSDSRQTLNNFERGIEDLYDRAVIPYAEILFSGLTKLLRHRYRDSFECISYDPESITALRGRMIRELKERKEINIETVNELREGLPNREPLEGMDTFYQPATLIPAGEDIFTEAAIDEE